MDMYDRIATKFVVLDNGCWQWTAATNANGYGRFRVGGKGSPLRVAHRVMWELLVGPVPNDCQLDHLCRNRGCVNPSHLEPVSASENTRRSFSQDVCRNGHPRTNVYEGRGRRECKECRRAASAKHYSSTKNVTLLGSYLASCSFQVH